MTGLEVFPRRHRPQTRAIPGARRASTTRIATREDGRVLIVRATKKLLRLVGPPVAGDDELSGTMLGSWYATVLFWRPQVALLVNESTLLPVLMPLAPAATLSARIGEEVAVVLAARRVPEAVVTRERGLMAECRFGVTVSRRVIGIMNEFARLGLIYRKSDSEADLLDLTVRLASTPCSPLYGGSVSPDRELAAKVCSIAR